MIEAVVFDLDGVVIDSEPVWEEVRRGVVAEFGGTWMPDTQKRLMGMSTPEWADYLAGELGVWLSPDETAATVIERMAERYRHHLPLLPHAAATMRAVADQWPIGVASSSPAVLIDTVLTALDVDVRVAISTETMKRGKPAPDVYLAVVERLGVTPGRCVAVEDSSNGLRSAAAAGLIVVAVPQEAYPPDEDALAGAALVLTDLAELTPEAVARLA
ncbi:HAD family hydrolase [Herbidospora cretacea]|uniref:HAD family hydrolase n=1 Tax=Herbidospora cretacea TaxID=28444 RepID=UPI0004C3A439|nr:HAD family phosphatase [Herbidospora cretacea]